MPSYAPSYNPGDAIEAQIQGYLFWFPGKIARRSSADGAAMDTYEVHFDDGDVDLQVPYSRIRRPVRAAREKQKDEIIAFLSSGVTTGEHASASAPPATASASLATGAVPEDLDPLGLGRSADSPSRPRRRLEEARAAAGRTMTAMAAAAATSGTSRSPATGAAANQRGGGAKVLATTTAVVPNRLQQQQQQPAAPSSSRGPYFSPAGATAAAAAAPAMGPPRKREPGEGIEALTQPVTDHARVRAFLELVRAHYCRRRRRRRRRCRRRRRRGRRRKIAGS